MNGWVNNGEAGDLRCRRAHYDVSVMETALDTKGRQIGALVFYSVLSHRSYWTNSAFDGDLRGRDFTVMSSNA